MVFQPIMTHTTTIGQKIGHVLQLGALDLKGLWILNESWDDDK
jgi:hypothetical protein